MQRTFLPSVNLLPFHIAHWATCLETVDLAFQLRFTQFHERVPVCWLVLLIRHRQMDWKTVLMRSNNFCGQSFRFILQCQKEPKCILEVDDAGYKYFLDFGGFILTYLLINICSVKLWLVACFLRKKQVWLS